LPLLQAALFLRWASTRGKSLGYYHCRVAGA
jgi:hypothetical protein